ncbi:serine/threonine-protein kinase [Arthrobacter sp. RIT-PI-e]|uniref:serine/threonine-protein kinase n=1 Tax=Arthrobacter sp. RIT-PI-e TaxID=1681197 RepID=UPI000676626F|nr:serine/threonine-protein kinase [Arthrobacter sp. RIT-PI-e]
MEQQVLAGRYVLGPRVGTGGMAEVFEAHDTRLERDVAVKLFRAGAADGIERGSAEARLLAGLDHPGLVRVLDMDAGEESGERAYLVMELVRGPDLNVLLRSAGALGREGVRRLALELARTLEYIHGRGIVHRDIKPSNILTRPAEQYGDRFGHLLTDFGIARFFDGGRLTATGQVIGSAAYFSPEQARGDDVGQASDVYSLALVLIECLTGEKAFPGTGVESALVRLHRGPSIPHAAGPGLSAVLMSMTLDDPGARPTAAALVRSLTALGPLQPHADALDRQDPDDEGDDDTTAASAAVPSSAPSSTGSSPTAAASGSDTSSFAPTSATAAHTTAAPATAAPPSPRAVPLPDELGTAVLARSEPMTRAVGASGSDAGTRTRAPDTARLTRALPTGTASTAALRTEASDRTERHRVPDMPPGDRVTTGRTPRKRRRTLLRIVTFGVLLAIAIGLWSSGVLDVGSAPDLPPLPPVPGETGKRLQELYESVQP